MPNYQPFLISEFKSGLYNYLAPWIRPQEAFEPLVNAYVYRGVLQKRNGSSIFGNQLTDKSPVMGIMQFANESTGSTTLVVASEDYLYYYTPGSAPDNGTFTKLLAVNKSFFWTGPNTAAPAPMFVFWKTIVPGTATISADITVAGVTTTYSVTFDATGAQTSPANAVFDIGCTMVFATGIVTLKLKTPPIAGADPISFYLTATLDGTTPYLTGNITNFFNWTNWQPTSNLTVLSTSYLYVTNGKDYVTLVNCDGTPYLARPGLYVNSGLTQSITNDLDVKVYANRLLLLRPTISPNTSPNNEAIAISAEYSPFNFISDVAGNGGIIPAATGDRIVSAEFLRDNLIVAFTNSTWTFQVTGLTSPPFIFRKINNTKSTQCPYAGVAYDERVTNIGNTGFVACDGINVQRYDVPIIDYYENDIAQDYYNQDYAQRYDNLSQTWTFYPSEGADPDLFPVVDSVAPGSDQVLVYNFLENTFATYENSFPMTCMGVFYISSGTTWAQLTSTWATTFQTWGEYLEQISGRMLLGGDTSGNVYWLDNEDAVRDGMGGGGQPPAPGTPFNVQIKTTRWNPFMQTGQKTQFGYVDVFYTVNSTPANPIVLTLNFFVDNSNKKALSQTLTLDGPQDSDFAWKRIYCNLTGEFVQIEIDPSEDAPFQILGFVLWARPAGRLTP